MTVDEAIRLFIALRDREAFLKAQTEEEVNRLKESRLKLSGWLKEQADAQGVKLFKTDAGSIFWKPIDFANVADWDKTLDFIRANGYWDMLEHSVSKKAVRAYINEYQQVPPGVNFGSRLEPNVRRPTQKVDDDK